MRLTSWFMSLVGLASALAHVPLLARDLKTILTIPHWSAGTTISFPGSETFTNATERWSIFEKPTYAVAVSPATEADVIQIVKLATWIGIPFLATGGRHGFTPTLGSLNAGLAIDLSQFDTVVVDKDLGTLTVGGGVRFRDIYDPVFAAGYEIQTGTCSCPGVVGVTLGAGIGPWSGVHGLVIDALLSLRVVTAKGELIEVSETSNPDLFWAFRGAGANFGVVVSATYQLQEQVNNGEVFVAEFTIPSESSAAYFGILESYNDGALMENLSISTLISYDSEAQTPRISSTWTYFGPEAEGHEVIQQVLSLGPTTTHEAVYKWNEYVKSVDGGADAYYCLSGSIQDMYTLAARAISASTYQEAFEKVSEMFNDDPRGRGSIVQISMFPNQAAIKVPEQETAYPWRDATVYIDIIFTWDSLTGSGFELIASQLGPVLRSSYAATAGYPELATYINAAHGDEPLESIYGASKLPRLVELKAAWDPHNVFRFNNPLPMKYR